MKSLDQDAVEQIFVTLTRMEDGMALIRHLRQVNPVWRRTVDNVGARLLAEETHLSPWGVEVLLRWMSVGSVVPWVRALSFWRCLGKVATLPTVTVAGSAALFVEHLLASRDPGFCPGDIDAWIDATPGSPHCYWDTESAVAAQLCSRLTTVDPLSVRLRRDSPGFKEVTQLQTRTGIKIQLIGQYGPCLLHTDLLGECQCDPSCELCDVCLSAANSNSDVGVGLTASEPEYQTPMWTKGMPHRRFDLDVAAVALRPLPGGYFSPHRLFGSPESSTMRMMAVGIWRFAGQRSSLISEADCEGIRKRLRKYASRGYTKILVAPKMRYRGGRGGGDWAGLWPDRTLELKTPAWLIEECNATLC